MTGVRGLDFLLDLPEAVALRAGDGLQLEDGRVVEVVAWLPEPLAEIRAADAAALTRDRSGISAIAICRPNCLGEEPAHSQRSGDRGDGAGTGRAGRRDRGRRLTRKAKLPMCADRRPHTGMTMVITTTTTGTTAMITPIITATSIIATPIIRASGSNRTCMGRIAATITTTRTITITGAMTTNSGEPGDLALFLWLSPAFPVGAFAYSHGLEWAVEAGDIVDALLLQASGWKASPITARRAPTRDYSPLPIAQSRARTGSA